MGRDKHPKRALHFLDRDGMVACNPRDREAVHRAQMEDLAAADIAAVTCRKCLAATRRAHSRPLSRSRAAAKSS